MVGTGPSFPIFELGVFLCSDLPSLLYLQGDPVNWVPLTLSLGLSGRRRPWPLRSVAKPASVGVQTVEQPGAGPHTGEQDCSQHAILCRCVQRIIHLWFWVTQWEAVTHKSAKQSLLLWEAGENCGQGNLEHLGWDTLVQYLWKS